MIQLPAPTSTWNTYTVVLDGTQFRLEYQWNSREEHWTLNLRDIDDNLLCAGLKLVPWLGLLRNHPQAVLPLGDLLLVDEEQSFGMSNSRPSTTNFGTKYNLYYLTQADLLGL